MNHERYILDTSALICYLEDEDGTSIVDKLIQHAENQIIDLIVVFASMMEIYYITWQEQGLAAAEERDELLRRLPLNRVDSSPELERLAGSFKARYHLSFADAWIAAVAKQLDALLVHKDPEFEAIESEIRTLKLPYKKQEYD